MHNPLFYAPHESLPEKSERQKCELGNKVKSIALPCPNGTLEEGALFQ
jgi:hypothetical protein